MLSYFLLFFNIPALFKWFLTEFLNWIIEILKVYIFVENFIHFIYLFSCDFI